MSTGFDETLSIAVDWYVVQVASIDHSLDAQTADYLRIVHATVYHERTSQFPPAGYILVGAVHWKCTVLSHSVAHVPHNNDFDHNTADIGTAVLDYSIADHIYSHKIFDAENFPPFYTHFRESVGESSYNHMVQNQTLAGCNHHAYL